MNRKFLGRKFEHAHDHGSEGKFFLQLRYWWYIFISSLLNLCTIGVQKLIFEPMLKDTRLHWLKNGFLIDIYCTIFGKLYLTFYWHLPYYKRIFFLAFKSIFCIGAILIFLIAIDNKANLIVSVVTAWLIFLQLQRIKFNRLLEIKPLLFPPGPKIPKNTEHEQNVLGERGL